MPIEGSVRTSRSCIEDAIRAGRLSADEMTRRGIVRVEDQVGTLADDAAPYYCPDEVALRWFLLHPAVILATRIMAINLLVKGGFTWKAAYRPELVAYAWAAAESFEAGWAHDADVPAFHRPYAGRAAEAIFPKQQPTNAEAHERAVAEHHELTERLRRFLSEAGFEGGLRNDVPVDLAWRGPSGDVVIAEIKSCFGDGDTEQLRLGLGQLLEYRERLVGLGVFAEAVLLVSRVKDDIWYDICTSVDVCLRRSRRR